jgi:PKD repeat protein
MHLAVTSKSELVNEVVLVRVYKPAVAETIKSSEDNKKSVRIAGISGSESLEVGAEATFRMRIETGAAWPIQYEWDLGDGSSVTGNYAVHRYSSPGVYRIRGKATNAHGYDSREMIVEVTRAAIVADVPGDGARDASSTLESPRITNTTPTNQNPRTSPANSVDETAVKTGGSSTTTDEPTETDLSVTDTKRTPVAAPNPNRNVSRIDSANGGYAWVVESLETAAGASTRAEDYKYLGFPYGYQRDRETGLYNVMVGQFESEWIALRVSWRIQQHAPRRIWLTSVK